MLSWFITVYKPVYNAFINLAVAFDAPMHQDINRFYMIAIDKNKTFLAKLNKEYCVIIHATSTARIKKITQEGKFTSLIVQLGRKDL